MKIIYGIKGKSDKNQIFVDENDLNMPIGSDSYSHPINFLKDIQNRKIEGEEVYKLFSYQDFSMWWFLYPTIFPSINRILNFIIQFEKMLDKYSPTEIKVVKEIEKLEIIKEICQSKKIKIKFSTKERLVFSLKKKIGDMTKKYYYSHVFKIKRKNRLSIIKSEEIKFKKIDKEVIFASATAYRRKNSDNNYFKNEYIQGEIMKRLTDRKIKISGIDVDYTFRGDVKALELRLEDPISWFPLELFLNDSKTNKENYIIKKILQVINNKEFQILFNFKNVNLWKFLENDFRKLSYAPYLSFYMEIIEKFTKIFENEKPKAIFLPYETGPISLALIIAAKRNSVKTFGIQHGVIYKNHPDYSHSIFQNEENGMGMIIPDKMLLFGEFAKELLMNLGYPDQNLEILGNPEFFNLDKKLEAIKKINLNKKYKIPENKFVILFTSAKAQRIYKNIYGNIDYDEKIWEELVKKLGNNDEYFIILKPHPSENIDIYQKILEKHNVSNCKIINDDLFELLILSSLIISIYSTTILDAICCMKPVIRVEFTNTTPVLPYDENNVVLSCKLDKMIENIHELKNNPQIKEVLLKNGKKFADQQYNINSNDVNLILKKILEY